MFKAYQLLQNYMSYWPRVALDWPRQFTGVENGVFVFEGGSALLRNIEFTGIENGEFAFEGRLTTPKVATFYLRIYASFIRFFPVIALGARLKIALCD